MEIITATEPMALNVEYASKRMSKLFLIKIET